jgi:hypothetical protein
LWETQHQIVLWIFLDGQFGNVSTSEFHWHRAEFQKRSAQRPFLVLSNL